MSGWSTASVPLPSTARKMERCLDRLWNLIGVRYGADERGRYIAGFGSRSIIARASEVHEEGTSAWFEAQGALLILAVVQADTAGDRSLASMDVEFADVEAAIITRAKLAIPAWTRKVAHDRSQLRARVAELSIPLDGIDYRGEHTTGFKT